ncbi:MAG: SH3 domain-containing protein [Lachnospiraceae bacterium]|nr:SH3 domain-containing protein [Lachnospiraceae bacterium]
MKINKKTLNAVMYGVIIVLVIGIGVSAVKLLTRPKIVEQPQSSSSENVEASITFYEESSEAVDLADIVVRARVIDDNINVRSGPGTDFERYGSAYYGNTLEYISQSHNGWTKIIYDGEEAYIYSEYIELVPMVVNVEGEFTEYLGADAPTAEEMIKWSDAAEEPAEGNGN